MCFSLALVLAMAHAYTYMVWGVVGVGGGGSFSDHKPVELESTLTGVDPGAEKDKAEFPPPPPARPQHEEEGLDTSQDVPSQAEFLLGQLKGRNSSHHCAVLSCHHASTVLHIQLMLKLCPLSVGWLL